MNEPAHLNYANARWSVAVTTVVMVMPPMVMMTMPAMMAMAPSCFGRLRPDILLDGRSSAGIAERQRAGALARRGYNEHGANGGKSQNFRHLHV